MKRKTVVFSVLAIIIAAILVLAPACSSGTTTAAVPQILRVNLGSEPAQIDPNQASWAQEKSVVSQVFVGLLGFNQDLTLRADVATVIPTVANKGISADGLTITFKLRNNVTWSDGQKVTANDFVYSIKREFDPTLACAYASFYYDIVGGEAYNSATNATDAQ